jgi:hypothetical protein
MHALPPKRVRLLVGVFGVASSIALFGAVGVAAKSVGSARMRVTDPLFGTWVTAQVRMTTVRHVLLAAHFTQADVNEYQRELGFTNAKNLRFGFTFHRQGSTKYALQRFWDASNSPPSGGDDGPYKLLAGQRVAISSAHPEARPWREVFAYRVQGNRLTLRFISATNPKETAKELRFDRVVMTAATAAPYARQR